jgi:hypothetical protein
MVVGGVIFAGLAVLCIVAGFVAVKRRGGFEPMTEEELEAEEDQP